MPVIFRKSPAAWIACLAMLTSTLAPSITLALAGTAALRVAAELCSSSRGDRMAIWTAPGQATQARGAPAEGPAQRDAAELAHCPACLGPPDQAGLAPAQSGRIVLAAGHGPAPALNPHVGAARRAWTSAEARAPPALA